MRIEDVLQRIQGEFSEMPGLCLTPAQAQRLWGLDRSVCDELLGALVAANFLARTREGAFIKREGAFLKTDSGPARHQAPRTAVA